MKINNFLNNYSIKAEPESNQWWVFVDYEVEDKKKIAWDLSNDNPGKNPELLKHMLGNIESQIIDDLKFKTVLSFKTYKKEDIWPLIDEMLTEHGDIFVDIKGGKDPQQLITVKVARSKED